MKDFFIDEDFPCSQIEFDKRFSTEQACRDYLIDMKWPDGFNCPKCGHRQKRDSDYYNNTENRRTKIGSYAIEQS
ncbi:MAG: transposase [Desulfobacterales bacterium]|nr:transposase [Desulfobacterales bacterium]